MKKIVFFFYTALLLLIASCSPVKYVSIPSSGNLDALPSITIKDFPVNGSTDIPDNGITSTNQVVNVSKGAVITLAGNAVNLKGGVKSFTITATKLPENTVTTATVSSQYSTSTTHTQPTILYILAVGNSPNAPVNYKFTTGDDQVIVRAIATNFTGGQNQITATFKIGQTTKRMSGASFFHMHKPESKDYFTAQNGILLVSHDPGCGISGNNGTDNFTLDNLNNSSNGFYIEKVEFHQFWPKVGGQSNPWSFAGAGSYGATQKSWFAYHWNNSCEDPYRGKKLFYIVSFIVSVPPGNFQIGEPLYDFDDKAFSNFPIPDGYQWNEALAAPQAQPAPSQNTSYTNYYFIIKCPSSVSPCNTLLVPATSLEIAKAYAQNLNSNCEVEQTDYNGYMNGCH